MRQVSREELREILERHRKWFSGEEGGERADLRGAYLSGADLRGAVGNSIHMKYIFLDTYPITYTAEVMQIGCQQHPIADWWEFSEERIREMDGIRAVEWWAKYKLFLQQAIGLSPAEPTGAEGKEAEQAA